VLASLPIALILLVFPVLISVMPDRRRADHAGPTPEPPTES